MDNLTMKQLDEIVDGLNEDELRQELKARLRDIEIITSEKRKMKEVLTEADQYLTPHPDNYIGNGSILHCKFKEAIENK